ncbi:MAG: mechanosensitive ion channel family protein [Ferruginibacter sp.]
MDFLDIYFLDNSLKSYLLVFGIILVLLFVKRYLSHYMASLLHIGISNYWKGVDKKSFIRLIIKPLGWLLTLVITMFMLDKLNYPAAWKITIYKLPLRDILYKTGQVLVIYSIIRVILSIINFIALILGKKAEETLNKNDDQLVIFFRDFLKVIIAIIGFLILLKAVFNQDIGRLLTGLSIVGAAMALAAKESLENLIASFIIFFDKPFHVGDTLKVNAITGTVESIGLRSTRIRTLDKTLVTVPNKQMVDSAVDNFSMRNQRRAEIKLELSSKTPGDITIRFLEYIKSLLEAKNTQIEKNNVFISAISNTGTTLTIEYFTAPFTIEQFYALRQEINLDILKKMENDDIYFSASGGSIQLLQPDETVTAPKSQPII